jgi:hypothetical protein
VIKLVDPAANDDWAADCIQLMPTYWARVEHEQEATWWGEQEATEEKFNEARCIASEEHRRIIGQQLEVDKREQENQQRLWKEEHD